MSDSRIEGASMVLCPFNWVREHAKRQLLLCLTVLLVLSTAVLMWMDSALVTAVAPNGIVSFELAGSAQRSAAILESWTRHAKYTALLIQGFDYLYLILYPAWFSLAAERLAAVHGGAWQRWGRLTSWLVLFAIPLDAIENYALIQQLLHGPSSLHAGLSWWCAVPKFALVGFATAFLVTAAGAWLVSSRRDVRRQSP